MIRVFSHYVSAKLVILVVLDALILALAVHLGFAFPFSGFEMEIIDPPIGAFPSVAAIVLGMLIIMSSMGLYSPDLHDLRRVLVRLVAAVVVGVGMVAVVMSVVVYRVPLLSLLYWWDALAIKVIVVLTASSLIRIAFYRWNSSPTLKSRVLVLGTGSRVMKVAELLQRNQNYVVVGYVALRPSAHHYVPLPSVLPVASGESLLSVAEKYGIDQIVIAVRDRRGGGLSMHELLECRLKGIKIVELATFVEREYRQVLLESLNPSWMVLGEGFRQGVVRTAVKRLFDVAVSTALLLVTLPVMLVTAFCIFLESGRPVLYRQERIGQGGRVFTIYKFRSMKNGAESDGIPRWAAANDDRITRVGRIIRKLRIDELPQLINVFKGEMSFVGPRPERPFFVDQLAKQIPYYSLRHGIKPGITGWAQVRYRYGASVDDAIEKLQYDLYYVKNHSVFLDLVILIATVEVVLWGEAIEAIA